jgi:hypothetical protein
MAAVHLAELRELLQGTAFSAWWTDHARAVATHRDAVARHADLLAQSELMEHRAELAQRAAIDAFGGAGVAEEDAAKAAAEAQQLENRALELVARFEDQRFRTSDLWYRLGGAEALQLSDRQRAALQAEYEGEDRKRAALWQDVERAWSDAFDRSLLAAEHGVRTRKVRREAERLFKEAEERRVRAKQLRAEAEAAGREEDAAARRVEELLQGTRAAFGCVPGRSFLYWRQKDEKRTAYAVALADDAENHNVEVKALAIYTVGRQRGVAFLEPAREGLAATAEEGDRRFDEYLLGPRRGAARRAGEGGGAGGGP